MNRRQVVIEIEDEDGKGLPWVIVHGHDSATQILNQSTRLIVGNLYNPPVTVKIERPYPATDPNAVHVSLHFDGTDR